MTFSSKSYRHLMLVWATSCVLLQPPLRFYEAPHDFRQYAPLCSPCLWWATKRHTWLLLGSLFPFSVCHLLFTRWQSLPHCLTPVGISSKWRSPVICLHGAHVVSSEGIKAQCFFHMSHGFNTPCSVSAVTVERPPLWLRFYMWESRRRWTGPRKY